MRSIYPDALDAGISPELFWQLSLNEILDLMESRYRAERRERRFRISDIYLLAKITAEYIGISFAGDKYNGEMPHPWDTYPKLFAEDKEEYERKQADASLEDYKQKRKAYAKEFNRRRALKA